MHPNVGFSEREEGVLQTLSTERRRESAKSEINPKRDYLLYDGCLMEFVCSITNILSVSDA